MSEINGSVNVSEILATLDDAQKAAVRGRVIDVVYENENFDKTMRWIDIYPTMTDIQQSAVRELLNEVKRRRQELLNELIETVEGAIMNG